MPLTLDTITPIKQTTSLCPRCRRQIEAAVYERGNKVYLGKQCPEHGRFEVLINSDARWYFPSQGAGTYSLATLPGLPEEPGPSPLEDSRLRTGVSGCCGGSGRCCAPVDRGSPTAGHDPMLIEKASTCIALIEIVETCNLKCPTCYADSAFSAPQHIKALSLAEYHARLDSVIGRKGPLDILQLSGGEPTLHPQFFELLEKTLSDSRIGYVLLNTNGVRLAGEDAFMAKLGELRRRLGKMEVYLQFDGTQAAGQRELRGADLRKMRDRAIERCGAAGIPVTLAMTVTPTTLPHLGDAVRYGLAKPAVRGMSFQPMFGSGRGGRTEIAEEANTDTTTDARLNVADVIHALIDQSDDLLTVDDFTPLPCGDPNCHTIGYLLRRGEDGTSGVMRVSDLIDFSHLQGFLKDRIDFNMEDLARCGCENEELGQVLKALEIGPENVFRLFIKPFMDAWTYDQHRIDRCCVHVVGEGGQLESFCRHYAMRG